MEKLTCYVSSLAGNDQTGTGTVQHPFETIGRAIKEVRLNKRYDTLFFSAGCYPFVEPLYLTKEDSHLKFCGERGTVFTGAVPLGHMEWEFFRQGIFSAPILAGWKVDAFYLDGKRQTMARYPNEKKGTLPLGGTASEADIKKRASSYTNVEGGRIRALHSSGWGGNSYLITGKKADSPLGLALRWVGDNNRGSSYDSENLVVENIFEELDVPGEWYYDSSGGRLYFYPPNEFSLSEAEAEVVLQSELIHMENVDSVEFHNIAFEKTAGTMFSIDEPGKEYVPLLRGDWCVVRSGALYAENCRNLSIQDCVFRDIGGNGIFFSGKNFNHKVGGNEFVNTGASCIQIVGLPDAVREPSYWPNDLHPELPVHRTAVMEKRGGPKTENYPHEITVSNNHMDGIGLVEKQSSGVNISMAKHITISHNTIHNSARSCVNINDGTFGGHMIAHNDFFDAQKETTDHGPFNSWGRDRFWSVPCYNAQGLYGEAAKPYALFDCQETTQIYHNRFYHNQNTGHSWGIDLDDGSSNYEISYNLCLGIGIKLREGFFRRVHHNILVCGQMNLHCTYHLAEDSIFSNLIVHTVPWQFAGMPEGERERLKDGWLTIRENWYYSPHGKVSLPEFWKEEGYDLDCVLDEIPLFADPASNDYTVRNQRAARRINFKNFSMDAFGKKGCPFHSPALGKDISSVPSGLAGNGEAVRETLWKGAVISNVTYGIMSALAANGTKGVYFKSVPKNSEAYDIGFRSNRIYKRINGRTVKNVEDLMKIDW